MNVINKLKLNFLYREFKALNIDDEILEQIITNKNFGVQYKTKIKPFIKQMSVCFQTFVENKILINRGLLFRFFLRS